jgi:hypothetical protein
MSPLATDSCVWSVAHTGEHPGWMPSTSPVNRFSRPVCRKNLFCAQNDQSVKFGVKATVSTLHTHTQPTKTPPSMFGIEGPSFPAQTPFSCRLPKVGTHSFPSHPPLTPHCTEYGRYHGWCSLSEGTKPVAASGLNTYFPRPESSG